MSSTSDNSSPQSVEEFAQHLRVRAEQAAEASVRHAGLSERYLELSGRLSKLAEKASASTVPELQAVLESIEPATSEESAKPDSAIPATAGLIPDSTAVAEQGTGLVHSPDVSAPPGLPEPSEALSEEGLAESELPTTPATAVPDEAAAAETKEVGESGEPVIPAPEDRPAKKRRVRSRRIDTRTFVERVRSARRAITRRIRVKAGKEDLKPQQRKALEEINRSRGSIASSGLVVIAVLFLLSLVTLRFDIDTPIPPIMASFADEIAEVEEPQPVEMPEEEQGEQQEEETEEPVDEPIEEPEPEETAEEPVEEPLSEPEPVEEPADAPEAEMETGEIASASEGDADQAAVDNRSAIGRQQMLEKFGGSAASESAVQRGLEWLASIQHRGGWWDFTEVGDAGDPGRVNNPIGATAYALMPFLAAGQTHQDGRFRKQVRSGLDYLCNIGISAPAGYDLRGVINKGDEDEEPNEAYYVHGAATLVLCEAYGMTRDRRLRRPAEGALRFLINSQDPRGGGWRYLPQQPGSTSVTAMQVMALVAAQKAGFNVPRNTLDGVMHYLDSVQVDGKGRYGYEPRKKNYKGSVTAMALLCRMYLGWGRDDGDMRAGIELLDKAGPYENLYSTYFAAQVMRNWGGDEWQRWNERMRDDLISTQVVDGPGAGSWTPRTGMHRRQGGRLLETSLATLTLEVYYRYKPVLPEPAEEPQVAAD